MPFPDDIPQGGRWFVSGGVAFHADAAGRLDFADDADGEPAGDWVTIGGGAGAGGERHAGGFPVKVAGGTPDATGKLRGGTIVGGKLAEKLGLHGKTTDEVVDHLAVVREHRDAGKSLPEAVAAAARPAAARPAATRPDADTPTTDRPASWAGTRADRYHWSGGGWVPSDGQAARDMPGRPAAWGVTPPAATHVPPTEADGPTRMTTPLTPLAGTPKAGDPASPVAGTREPATGPRPRIWKKSPVYLTGSSNPETARDIGPDPAFGILITPNTSQYLKHVPKYQQFAIDNGCYSQGGNFDEAAFLSLVKAATEDPVQRQKCLFAVAPDVYDPTADNGPGKDKGRGDPLATIERSRSVLPKIRALGVPAALVAQDGLEDHLDKIPWDDFDVLFVGGSTDFKLGHPQDYYTHAKTLNDPAATPQQVADSFDQNRNLKILRLVMECRLRGKAFHVGRVNSLRRLAIVHTFGAESADGTFLAFGPRTNVPKLKNWVGVFERAAELEDCLKNDKDIPPHLHAMYDKLTGAKKKRPPRPKKPKAPAVPPVPAGPAAFADDPLRRVAALMTPAGLAGDGRLVRAALRRVDAAGLRSLAGTLARVAACGTAIAPAAATVLALVREQLESGRADQAAA